MKDTPNAVEDFVVETKSNNVPTPTSTQQEATVAVLLQAVVNTINIIDLMVARGAFKGDEILAAGITREKLLEAVRLHITPATKVKDLL